MARRPESLPLVFAVIAPSVRRLSEQARASLRELLTKVRERFQGRVRAVQFTSAGVTTEIAREVEAAGFEYLQLGGTAKDEQESTGRGNRLTLHLIEMSDLALFISGEQMTDGRARDQDLFAYAEAIDRPTMILDSQTGVLRGTLPEQLEIDQGWLPQLFGRAGLPPNPDLETVMAQVSLLADKSAPLTRAKWNWVVFLQGLAVCVPLGWLLGFPVTMVGVTAFVTTVVLVSLHWWLRYRSMQKTWARARLVTEVTRSLLATFRYPVAWPWQTFATIPSLRPLRWIGKVSAAEMSFKDWLGGYLENRLGGQERYFADKQREAEKQRQKLSSWTTVLLDLALLFGVAGLVIALKPRDQAWMVGGSFAQSTLGSISILILLGLLLIQVVRELQELNRRTARFAQQQLVLQEARRRLSRVPSPELALEVIADTETKLLAEVFEWYFHAETAERFVEARESSGKWQLGRSLRPSSSMGRVAGALPGKLGTAGLFILRVVVGRLPWIAASVIAVMVWVSYRVADTGTDPRRLESSVMLVGSDSSDPFEPRYGPGSNKGVVTLEASKRSAKVALLRGRAEHGYVVLVHGLYGRGFESGTALEAQRNWMEGCANAIKTRMSGQGEPAICLVNWSDAAMPSNFYHEVFGKKNLLADLPAIRSQAYRVGDIVAFQLAGIILRNELPRNVPFHLVGHSAGGFVVARVAARLTELGIVPKNSGLLRVSILDTPEPDEQIMKAPPGQWPTDFYLTSYSTWELPFRDVLPLAKTSAKAPGDDENGKIHVLQIPVEIVESACQKKAEKIGFWLGASRKIPFVRDFERFWNAHRAAYCWFRETVENPNALPAGEGFNRSPVLRRSQHTVTRE